MSYSFINFHRATFADFKSCQVPKRPPDFYSFSGSTYWDMGDRVIRWSNHWGRNIRSCCWYIDGKIVTSETSIAGFCLYSEFKPVSFYREWLYKDWIRNFSKESVK